MEQITIRGARLHNLKNVTVAIPRDKLVVLTGVSGSGKSTLGFDILYKEGQRQFLKSLGMVEFGLARPPVDSISGLSPTISIDQHFTNRSPRSTVGTTTDIYTYLRVLYSRLGHRPCPACGRDIAPIFAASDSSASPGYGPDDDAAAPEAAFPCPHCGKPVPEIGMAHFSFNKTDGACPTCDGLGTIHQANLKQLVDETKSIAHGGVAGWGKLQIDYQITILRAAAAHYGFDFDLSRPIGDFTEAQRDLLFFGVESTQFRARFPQIDPPSSVRRGRFEGIATSVLRRYAEHTSEHVHDADYSDKLDEFLVSDTCPDCDGTRLKPESRQVTIDGRNIIAASADPLTTLESWLNHLSDVFSPDELRIASPALEALHARIQRVLEVGAGYLTVDRASPTLSAGEAQRLRLATLLGSDLSGLLYVLDEPTIGLHARDTRRLIDVLHRLRDLGNTVLVIEHDLEMISAADHVIDFGRGAGKHGGQVVAAGTPQEIQSQPESLTGAYVSRRVSLPVPRSRRAPNGRAITVRGARHHNLQNITVRIPLGLLVAVTGVSGSGKSTLIFDVLDRAVRQRLHGSDEPPGEHDGLDGCENIDDIAAIDQHHIGRVPRSNAATYTDTFTPIRATFAATPEARRQGLTARHFSFNVPGGRCERCEGAGVLTVQMQLLPDEEVRCPVCHGRRFKPETLAVRFHDRDISEVLDMTVEDALELFREIPAVTSRLQVLSDAGLGYLQLGQPATTLSGGEAQRVKLAKELGRRVAGRTLYLLDEPTTGLHLADIARLLLLLSRLVDAGNTVLVVEHNLELVKAADWVIDLGPEGGADGGRLVAEGTPEEIAAVTSSHTGHFLKSVL